MSNLRDQACGVPLRQDAYRAERGGAASLVLVSCNRCRCELFLYQKDGPGPLLRCYLNRIGAAAHTVIVAVDAGSIEEIADLTCPGCAATVGTPSRYRDGRLAHELLPDAVSVETLRSEGSHGS
jgi:hypothetical protein